jgi:hypothetical protein
MYLLTIVSCSILLLSTAAYSAVVRGRDDARGEMITITIFDCNPAISSFAYRLVCSASTDSTDHNFCETQLPSAPTSPPGGSQGISTWTIPQEGDIPDGCQPGSEGLRAVGGPHVKVGTMIPFGMVEIVKATTEGCRLSVETKANVSHLRMDRYHHKPHPSPHSLLSTHSIITSRHTIIWNERVSLC